MRKELNDVINELADLCDTDTSVDTMFNYAGVQGLVTVMHGELNFIDDKVARGEPAKRMEQSLFKLAATVIKTITLLRESVPAKRSKKPMSQLADFILGKPDDI